MTTESAIDPTANVLALVTAEARRQDDLRIAEARYTRLEAKRLDDLARMRHNCDQELADTRLQAQRDATLAESRRIDAINAAQKVEVALTAERASATAATLAQTLVTTAETLRTSQAASVEAITQQIRRLQETLEAKIAPLERERYLTGGRSEQEREFRTIQREDKASQYTLYGLALSILGAIAYVIFGG